MEPHTNVGNVRHIVLVLAAMVVVAAMALEALLLTGTVTYQPSTDTATLDPTTSLRSGVTYKAIVSTGAKDVAGNPLDQNSSIPGLQQKAWLFTVSN